MADRVCPWWHAYFFDNWLRRLVHLPEKILGPYLTEGMTALDVGCGMGFFSIAMARMIGDEGRVIAVDLQQEMLDVLLRRARRKGVADRIRAQRCSEDELGVEDEVDFALAFWVVHETPDPAALARQVRRCLKPAGRFLVAEPVFHVSRGEFRDTEAAIGEAGLRPCERPRIRFSRTALFENA